MLRNKEFSLITLLSAIIIIGILMLIIGNVITDINYGTKTGKVIDKRYNSSYVTYSHSSVNNVNVNIPVTHPESYQIKISKIENGKEKSIWIDITKEEYNKIKIGDSYGM